MVAATRLDAGEGGRLMSDREAMARDLHYAGVSGDLGGIAALLVARGWTKQPVMLPLSPGQIDGLVPSALSDNVVRWRGERPPVGAVLCGRTCPCSSTGRTRDRAR